MAAGIVRFLMLLLPMVESFGYWSCGVDVDFDTFQIPLRSFVLQKCNHVASCCRPGVLDLRSVWEPDLMPSTIPSITAVSAR